MNTDRNTVGAGLGLESKYKRIGGPPIPAMPVRQPLAAPTKQFCKWPRRPLYCPPESSMTETIVPTTAISLRNATASTLCKRISPNGIPKRPGMNNAMTSRHGTVGTALGEEDRSVGKECERT